MCIYKIMFTSCFTIGKAYHGLRASPKHGARLGF
jgi:hypothetical protein